MQQAKENAQKLQEIMTRRKCQFCEQVLFNKMQCKYHSNLTQIIITTRFKHVVSYVPSQVVEIGTFFCFIANYNLLAKLAVLHGATVLNAAKNYKK